MLFNSVQFVLFFLSVSVLYYAVPGKFKTSVLLLGSCWFYMVTVPEYLLLMGAVTAVDYFAGRYIEKSAGWRRKIFLLISIIANIGVLFVLKYFNFFIENVEMILGAENGSSRFFLSLALPLGLSYQVFQSLCYTIDIHRKKIKAEKNFLFVALYLLFFPKLVAGPIERPGNLIPQFKQKVIFDYYNVTGGLKQMLWGFFQKLVIADRLAIYVNAVYNNPQHHNGNTLIIASVFFAFQIYCDFAGYSNIAIGTAKVMGYNLSPNFNLPYFSRTIADFWNRWHISLSTWLRDYLFMPLAFAFSRKMKKEKYFFLKSDLWIYMFAAAITFTLCGLWHGADITYIIWGFLNGVYLIIAIFTKKLRKKVNKAIGITKFPKLNTFSQVIISFMLICFAWIFFRANNASDAFLIIKKIFTVRGDIFTENPSMMIYALFGITVLLFVEFRQEYFGSSFSFFNNRFRVVRYLTYSVIMILILLIGVFDGGQFIYFQF